MKDKGVWSNLRVLKRGVLRKTYRIIGFQWFFLLTKWWGRVKSFFLFPLKQAPGHKHSHSWRLLLNDNWEKRWEMVEQQVLTKWCLFWGTRSKHASKIHTQEKKSNIRAEYISVQNGRVMERGGWCTGTMGNKGFAMAAKKICKAWNPYKMTIKNNQVIPYKMKGPNPAKFSNCISRLLYASDSILKSYILISLTIWQGAGRLPTKWP